MLQKGMALCLSVFLVCVGIKVFAQEKPEDRVVSERLIAQIYLSSSSGIEDSLKVSPDSKRVAYKAKVVKKQVVVVDGKEEKQYDGIGTPIFSPDGKRVAYGAEVDNKRFVVVDGKEEKQYDSFLAWAGRSIVFDSPDSLHYLAIEGSKLYMVEEKIK